MKGSSVKNDRTIMLAGELEVEKKMTNQGRKVSDLVRSKKQRSAGQRGGDWNRKSGETESLRKTLALRFNRAETIRPTNHAVRCRCSSSIARLCEICASCSTKIDIRPVRVVSSACLQLADE